MEAVVSGLERLHCILAYMLETFIKEIEIILTNLNL